MSGSVELVAGAVRLPLGGVNGYKHVRSKQGRTKDLFQGTTPRKSRHTALFGTAREAVIALAELKVERPDGVDDPIKLLDFSSPALAAPCCFRGGRSLAASQLQPPRVQAGAPLTAEQSSVARMCGLPFVLEVTCG